MNDVAVLIREFPGGDLDEVNEPADPEQAAGEEVENARADLARGMPAPPTKMHSSRSVSQFRGLSAPGITAGAT